MDLSYFGKLSSRADFVRFNASSDGFRAMDEWIQEGLRFVQSRHVENFEHIYDTAGPSCFLFHNLDGSGPLVGTIRPSRDLSGRKYPFFAALQFEPGGLARIPVSRLVDQFSDLFESTRSMVDDAVEGRVSTADLDEVIHQQAKLIFPSNNGSPDGVTVLDKISFSEFCTKLWDTFQDSRKYVAFKNLLDIFLPLKGRGQPRLGYGLQFPLIEGDLLIASVIFWLEVCLRLIASPDLEPTLIWNIRRGSDGAAPSLYINFSKTPASGIVQILQLSLDLENLFRVDTLGTRDAAEIVLSIPERYGRLIETEEISLLQFLDSLN
ncbi:MAG: hypothetical protein BMS9Abin05_2379 [Rhodothermia bacterium]|nr:MAG: hypothetical protein BMS9Abin05_2379 [Rhodothermia bacterium]